jgi:cyanophycinase-like exopeptidase
LAEIGAENVRLCRASSASEFDKPELKQALSQARGVWFTGAQERRMLDLVLQSRLDRIVQDVLDRGGVVGGSSAGAKIHGDGVLCQSTDDEDPLCDIYACGLNLLPGIVIEQQKADADPALASTVAKALLLRFPRCVGLGLQESAAVIVRGHTMQVVGSDSVAVISEPPNEQDAAAVEIVHAGQKYDLRERRRMDTEEDQAATK